MVSLSGMTWNHPRGYEPLVACAAEWRRRTDVEVRWDKRSLQDFESYPVEELAARYDLIVIDHPHVGQITAENCLLPLDGAGHDAEAAELARASVGRSFPSYHWQGRQWALPIDAAAQVQAWRPDLIGAPARTWAQVSDLAARGLVGLPLRPPHSLMAFFTLAANCGTPCATSGPGDLLDGHSIAQVYVAMGNLVALTGPDSYDMDPIAVLERMSEANSRIACVPLVYGYVSYARDGFRPARIDFANIPDSGHGPIGSALGGTGLAVSARSKAPQAAIDFAYFVAGSAVQRGIYAHSGGQPGHAEAWADAEVNTATHGFYDNTRATLEGAWLRPRHNGYMAFQDAAADRINAALRRSEAAETLAPDLNALFRKSFAG